jgi:hypothetical protein
VVFAPEFKCPGGRDGDPSLHVRRLRFIQRVVNIKAILGRGRGLSGEARERGGARHPLPDTEITLEIQADVPQSVPDQTVRIARENCRALKFKNHGFEKE